MVFDYRLKLFQFFLVDEVSSKFQNNTDFQYFVNLLDDLKNGSDEFRKDLYNYMFKMNNLSLTGYKALDKLCDYYVKFTNINNLPSP